MTPEQRTHARQLFNGADSRTLQARLASLRKARAKLEAEYATHPRRTTALHLAVVYEQLRDAILECIGEEVDMD